MSKIEPTGEVHPAAAVWPMLSDEDMQSLADSIREIGLLEPIVLTSDGAVLDGRNRLVACKIAGVKPVTVVYDGDPVAFVLARNDERRHMTKGQRAMAAWLTLKAYNNYTPSTRMVGRETGTSPAMVGWAKVVDEHAPSLIERVLRPTEPMSLKAAYDEAVRIRDLPDTRPARMAALEQNAPDLAKQVDAGLSLSEAEAAWRQREQDRADRIERNAGYLRTIASAWALLPTIADSLDFVQSLERLNDRDRQLAEDAVNTYAKEFQ